MKNSNVIEHPTAKQRRVPDRQENVIIVMGLVAVVALYAIKHFWGLPV